MLENAQRVQSRLADEMLAEHVKPKQRIDNLPKLRVGFQRLMDCPSSRARFFCWCGAPPRPKHFRGALMPRPRTLLAAISNQPPARIGVRSPAISELVTFACVAVLTRCHLGIS